MAKQQVDISNTFKQSSGKDLAPVLRDMKDADIQQLLQTLVDTANDHEKRLAILGV